MNQKGFEDSLTGLEIAVIGMTGRFPGAGNIDDFWKNLVEGREGIAFLSDDELKEAGVRSEIVKNPLYVKACGWMEGIECFDASFFGYTPVEAEIMDPQVRIFHECVLGALENAGYDPYSYRKLIGIYAGASANLDWQARVELSGKGAALGWFASKQLTDKDFLATRIAHRLNLKGPAITLDTACSTSLVAIHMACQGLLSGDCDMALAGGVSLVTLVKAGYPYQEGMLNSPDGHCRAFDARAKGTNFGNASVLVVLKRLEDALADGDTVHAVVKGSAVNNDGDRKAAYTAPSIEGQSAVIRNAQKMAEVEPETVGYVETHGTGTPLGDPVEIESLKSAFNNGKKHFCRIGSVKTNVGHLEMAAGVTGFIKTVLTLKHRLIPPNLFFENPNPGIDFENSPFIVNNKLTPWEPANGRPLRAGVSSFGIGGTNAHVVLEEWPGEGRGTRDEGRKHHLIVLSAKTETALDKMTQNLGGYLKENPGIDMADAAYTLQVGRKVHPYRRVLVCSGAGGAAALLSNPGSGKIVSHCSREDNPSVVFMFPGQGAQYVNMGRGLYEEEPLFRDRMDRCFKLLEPLLDENLKEILYPPPGDNRSDKTDKSYSEKLNQPEISQLAIFIIEYALAELLLSWGIRPHGMIGYSFGEYAAACVSGVFSLEDALKLVVFRGKLIRKVPPGVMLSVPLSMKEIIPLLQSNRDVSAAIDNGPSCIVAGPGEAVDAFEAQMKEKKLLCMRVPVFHAIHTEMMSPILNEFEAFFSTLTLNEPQIPYISNVTGDWITGEEASNPRYWSNHLKQTARFAQGMKVLSGENNSIFIEIGPGRDISTLALRHLEGAGNGGDRPGSTRSVINLVRHPRREIPDVSFLLERIGRLWLYGQEINWPELYAGEKRRRIPLPTYPFEKQRYWIDGGLDNMKAGLDREPGFADRFYIPTWERSVTPWTRTRRDHGPAGQEHCLVFLNEKETIGPLLVSALKQSGREVVEVTPGTRFSKNHRGYAIDPDGPADYHALFHELHSTGVRPQWIVHLWGVTGKDPGETGRDRLEEFPGSGFYHFLYLAKAVGKANLGENPHIFVITDGVQEVTGDEPLSPGKASVIGPVKVLPQEFPGTRCRNIDIVPAESGSREEEQLVGRLLEEFSTDAVDSVVAIRGNFRWVQTFKPLRLDEAVEKNAAPPLREGGVYLVTGGTGVIGLILARYLAEEVRAKVILTGRSPFPPRRDWDKWRAAHGEDDAVSVKIKEIKEIEETGAGVLVFSADAADGERMREAIVRAEKQFGPVNGVFHAAGIVSGKTFRGIREIGKEECRAQFRAKADGVMVLEELFRDRELDFCCLVSSISTVLGGLEFAAYAAANSFMDAYVKKHNRLDPNRWISVDWDGMGVWETRTAFHRILSLDRIDQVAVSNIGNLPDRIAQWINPVLPEEKNKTGKTGETSSQSRPLQPRPPLSNPYSPPRNQSEQDLADIWQSLFGMGPLGIYDDFIELGGDSLKAITMIGRVQKELNAAVPLTEFFEDPTIRRLSEYVTGAEKGTHPLIPIADEKEYYALSSAQKRLFLLEHLGDTGTAYNIFSSVNIDGPLDVELLEETFRILVRRHESFRTSFHLIGGEPAQRIHRDLELKVEHFDLPGNRGETMEIVEGFSCPFDLARPPLLRVGLVKTGEEKHILLVNMHHIVSDGVSMVNFIREFTLLYAGEPLPPLTLQYKDFSEWQNTLLTSGKMEKQENYWLDRFKEEIPVLELPLDYARPTVLSYEGEREDFRLGMEDTAFLKGLALEEKASLFIVLLAVYTVFISKLSGQEDIIVGVPIAGRKNPELEPIMGMFVNTLALRNFPTEEKSFLQFLKEVKGNSLRAFENQDYQFENLVENVSLRREPGRNPIFDTMFTLQNTGISFSREVPDSDSQELKVTPHSLPHKTSIFDLRMEAVEEGEELSMYFEYRTRLFKRETVQRFVTYFKNLLSNVREVPRKGLGDLEIIPEEEKKRVLVDFNDTAADYPRDKTINRLFEEQVERRGQDIAVIGGPVGVPGGAPLNGEPGRFTYRELNEISNRLALRLKETGVNKGTIAAIMVERTPAVMVGLLAILKAGGAYLPLDPEYPAERIKYILEKSGARLLLTQRNLTAGNTFAGFEGKIIDIFDERSYLESPGGEFETKSESTVTADDAAYVIYTSGSTGNPKGVMIRHRNAVNFIGGMAAKIDFSAGKTILALTTISFDIFFLETLLPVTRGMKVVIADEAQQKDPALLESLILENGVDMLQVTPSRLQLLLNMPGGATGLEGVSRLLVGGEAFPPHLFEAVQKTFKGYIYNVYGPTETTIWSTVKDLSAAPPGELTIGNPIANTHIYIVNRECRLQTLGVAGELLIGGDGVAAGYLNNVELTAEKFIESPFAGDETLYRTGDLARWLPNGEIEFLGRLDHQVKIRGFRIEPGEIEKQLSTHPRITGSVVLDGMKESGEKYLCAYFTAPEKMDISPLRDFLGRRLPAYMIPAYFMQLEKIPLTPNGKIDRKRLGSISPEIKLESRFTAPESDNEKTIAAMWKEVLKRDRIGIHDNFFALGGNSLDIINVNIQLNRTVGKDIRVLTLFEYPTIHSLARYLEEGLHPTRQSTAQKIEQFEATNITKNKLKRRKKRVEGELK